MRRYKSNLCLANATQIDDLFLGTDEPFNTAECYMATTSSRLSLWNAVQIDDLFLATEEPFNTSAPAYRMTPADSKALTSFGANVPNLPPGSSFRVSYHCCSPTVVPLSSVSHVFCDSNGAVAMRRQCAPPGTRQQLPSELPVGFFPSLS